MSSGNIVKLNIGGAVFQTSKSTLTRFDGFFKVILETAVPLEKDDAGCIFIDRSPKHFERILNFMRDGDVVLPKCEEDILEIQKEAQYYLLFGLVDLCKGKLPVDLPVKLRIIESDGQMLQIIAYVTNKPVIIVHYFVSSNDFNHNSKFNFQDFMKKYESQFDIYFKPFHRAFGSTKEETRNTFEIYKSTGIEFRGFLDSLESHLENYFNGEIETARKIIREQKGVFSTLQAE